MTRSKQLRTFSGFVWLLQNVQHIFHKNPLDLCVFRGRCNILHRTTMRSLSTEHPLKNEYYRPYVTDTHNSLFSHCKIDAVFYQLQRCTTLVQKQQHVTFLQRKYSLAISFDWGTELLLPILILFLLPLLLLLMILPHYFQCSYSIIVIFIYTCTITSTTNITIHTSKPATNTNT